MVIETIDQYFRAADPEHFDVVQEFSAFFPVEVITRMLGVPEDRRQQVREWVDTSLHREPGQVEMSEEGMQAIAESMGLYYKLIQERRAEPQDDMFSRLVAAEIEREDGEKESLDDFEIAGFATLLGGAGAETVTKLIGNAAVTFARYPDQWQKLLDDRSKIPAAVEELLRYEAPVQYNVRRSMREVTCTASRSPRANRCSCSAVRRTGIPRRSPMPTHSTSTATAPRRRTSASVTACTAASAPRWPGWRVRSRSSGCSTSCRATRCSGTTAKRVAMQNVAGWSHVPVRVLG